jgi:hypothetical protein
MPNAPLPRRAIVAKRQRQWNFEEFGGRETDLSLFVLAITKKASQSISNGVVR